MAEQQILRLGCNGLTTDPGPFAGVPDGAMVEAQNVIFRRPGVAEPRPPLQFTRDTTATGSCYGAFAFDDGTSVTPQWIGSSGWRAGGTTTVSGGFTFSQYKTRHSSYRGRGFFTSDQGIAVLDGASDTSARLAGVPRGVQGIIYATATATPTGWLNAGYGVSYRTVIRRMAGTIPLRGSPSERLDVVNDTGVANKRFTVRFYLTSDIISGDYLEIYRTPTSAATTVTNGYGTFYDYNPADEGSLRDTLLIGASDVSAGYVDWSDQIPDESWSGPYLYTNSSQDGILLANERPNYCVDVATYNRMQFFGGQRSPQRVTTELRGIGAPAFNAYGTSSSADIDHALYGWACTVTTTLGSTTLSMSGIDSIAGIRVGQYIANGTAYVNPETGGSNIPANTYVVSINAGARTLVMSNAATGAATFTGAFFDWLEVDDGSTKRKLYTIAAGMGPAISGYPVTSTFTKLIVPSDSWSSSTGSMWAGGASSVERAWSASYGTTSFRVAAVASGTNTSQAITLRIERTDSSLGSFTVRSSKPLAFDQYVDSVTGVTSSQEGTPGRLAWSKIDEPESAPLPYYADIGDPNLPIYRIMAVQDALYVFKADGIWRVFGDDPQNLVIQQVDATARLTLGMAGCVARYGNSLYAWTQRGIVECGNFGVRNIDGPVYNQANAPLGSSPDTNNSGWACAHWYGRWIAFCSGASGAPAYVYHPEMGTWASWTFRDYVWAASTPIGGTYSTNNAPIFGITKGYGQANVAWPVPETATYITPLCGGDLINGVTISSVVGTTVTINSGSLWAPAVGDAIVTNASGPYYVTSVTSATVFDVDRTGSGTSVTYVYDAYPAKITWTAAPAGNPASIKHFVDSVLMFSRVLQGRSLTERYQGYQNPTEATNVVTYDSDGTAYATVKPYVRRGHVDKTVGRDWALKLGFTIQQGATFWTLDGAAVSYVFTGTRL